MLTVGFASGDCGHHSMSCWDTLRARPLCAGSISPWDDWLPTASHSLLILPVLVQGEIPLLLNGHRVALLLIPGNPPHLFIGWFSVLSISPTACQLSHVVCWATMPSNLVSLSVPFYLIQKFKKLLKTSSLLERCYSNSSVNEFPFKNTDFFFLISRYLKEKGGNRCL